MLMKALVVAGALILAAAGGTAYAADDVPTKHDTYAAFGATLGGIEAEALSSAEMDATRGQVILIFQGGYCQVCGNRPSQSHSVLIQKADME